MSWQAKLTAIQKDYTHGATYLTQEAVKVLQSIESKEELMRAAKRVQSIQPCMASLYNLGAFVLDNIDTINAFWLSKWLEEFEAQNKKAIQKCAPLLQNQTILTHSFSSLVYEAIKLGSPKKIICTESRPHNEGVALAKRLYSKGFEVELVSDAAASIGVQEADIVLFGADGVGNFGLVHKIGSFTIALAAKQYQKRLFSIAPIHKFWPKNYPPPKEPLKEPLELGFFKAKNLYFDITPKELVTNFIN